MGLLPLVEASDVLVLHCPLCCYHTHWLSQLEVHFNTEHKSQSVDFTLYQCSKCRKIASSKSFLLEHVELHHKNWSTNDHHQGCSPPQLERDSSVAAVLENGHCSETEERDNVSPLSNVTPHTAEKRHLPYVKTLFVGQLSGGSSSTNSESRLSNGGPVLGLEHQCLFCDFTTSNSEILSEHYARHGIRKLQLPIEFTRLSEKQENEKSITDASTGILTSTEKRLNLSHIRSNPLAAMDELTKVCLPITVLWLLRIDFRYSYFPSVLWLIDVTAGTNMRVMTIDDEINSFSHCNFSREMYYLCFSVL